MQTFPKVFFNFHDFFAIWGNYFSSFGVFVCPRSKKEEEQSYQLLSSETSADDLLSTDKSNFSMSTTSKPSKGGHSRKNSKSHSNSYFSDFNKQSPNSSRRPSAIRSEVSCISLVRSTPNGSRRPSAVPPIA